MNLQKLYQFFISQLSTTCLQFIESLLHALNDPTENDNRVELSKYFISVVIVNPTLTAFVCIESLLHFLTLIWLPSLKLQFCQTTQPHGRRWFQRQLEKRTCCNWGEEERIGSFTTWSTASWSRSFTVSNVIRISLTLWKFTGTLRLRLILLWLHSKIWRENELHFFLPPNLMVNNSVNNKCYTL